jgi:hypothetical protein
MLRTVNKNISLSRGESATIEFVVWNNDGTPYILPPLDSTEGLQTVVAFTVYTADGRTPVITKYLDMFDGITSPYYNSNGDVAYIQDTNIKGFNKFSSRHIYTITTQPEEFYSDPANRLKICAHTDSEGIMQYFYYNEAIEKPLVYEFGLNIVLIPEDTAKLKPGDYKYDVSAYIGELDKMSDALTVNAVAKLPLIEPVIFKQQLVQPHKFTLEDSLNA